MWSECIIASPTTGNKYKCYVKHFMDNSDFGIEGGRISKLVIRKDGENRDICNCDWNMAVDCNDDEVREIYEIILSKYN